MHSMADPQYAYRAWSPEVRAKHEAYWTDERRAAARRPWTLRHFEISQCMHCGTQTFWQSGRTCRKCYGNPQIRADYLNQGARKRLRFARYRLAFEVVPASNLTTAKMLKSIETCSAPGNFYIPLQVPQRRPEVEMTLAPYPKPLVLGRGRTLWKDLRPKWTSPKLSRGKTVELPVRPTPIVAYPFIRKAKDEHADLLFVNSIVPTSMPGREDVCQEILLALFEQRITLNELKANRANLRSFVASFRRDNYESGGYAVSLDQPMYDGRSWHDTLSSDNSPWI